MTEIESILTATLIALEQEIRQKQEAQAKAITEQELSLTAHTDTLRLLQKQVSHLSIQQQEYTQHLERLIDIYKNFGQLLRWLEKINSREKND
ncbi:hypothetical protein [Solidesulfovibrio sp.]|uniref:hypothetical protein n=1 Tax=Solidesulfovibrio sp. TaxID=2910990 RepID=UPI00261304CE|nr:hypothetical protein [Solidesulfovibrio sp.]